MRITDLKIPGAIFASAITTSEIELNNYQEVTFLVESGEVSVKLHTPIINKIFMR